MSERNGRVSNSHAVHEMMSRTGSFPVGVACRFIEQFCKPSSTVLDPFCGKGTTLLAARILGHHAYGLDVAPEAVLCSSAKLSSVTLSSFRKYINEIRLGSPHLGGVPDSVMTFFDPTTLAQVLSLKRRFSRDIASDSATIRSHALFGMGCLLGILHGHASYSLSISSSHAFSMAPGYVACFAKLHGLLPPVRDVKSCLLAKAQILLREPLLKAVKSEVKLGCARQLSSTFPKLVGKVDLILTSPPYLSAQTYAKDNWLRLWLLGYDHRMLKPNYIETGSITLYRSLMADVFRQCETMLKPGGYLVCIAGDVRRTSYEGGEPKKSIFKTGCDLAKLLKTTLNSFDFVKRGNHTVKSSSRYFHSLSKSNGHSKRSLTERFFVAQKAEP